MCGTEVEKLPQLKSDILYGIHPVLECIRAGRRAISAVYTVEGKTMRRLEQVISWADRHRVPIEALKPSRLESLARSPHHQGVAVRASAYPWATMADITGKKSQAVGGPLVLAVDSLQDPHNLGALVRTALCVGVGGILLPKDRSAAPSPTVCKASAGALEHVRMVKVVNLAKALKQLKESGLWVAGLDRDADDSVFAADLTGPLAIVIGGEQKGIRPLVKKQCDFLLTIPQQGPLGSLNASVAGAVTMYEAFRQRLTAAND